MWNVASNEAFVNVPTLSNINRSSSLKLPFNFLTWNTSPLRGLKLIRSMASVELARMVYRICVPTLCLTEIPNMDGIFWYTFEREKYIAEYLKPNVAKTSIC